MQNIASGLIGAFLVIFLWTNYEIYKAWKNKLK